MTLGILEILPAKKDSEVKGDGLFHLVCTCDIDKALCGKDVTDWPFTNGENEPHCVVCADLDRLRCERCGADNAW